MSVQGKEQFLRVKRHHPPSNPSALTSAMTDSCMSTTSTPIMAVTSRNTPVPCPKYRDVPPRPEGHQKSLCAMGAGVTRTADDARMHNGSDLQCAVCVDVHKLGTAGRSQKQP